MYDRKIPIHEICANTTLELPFEAKKANKSLINDASVKPMITAIGELIVRIFDHTQIETILHPSAKVTKLLEKSQPGDLFEEIL